VSREFKKMGRFPPDPNSNRGREERQNRRLSRERRSADDKNALESPARRLTRESADLVKEFLRLNRRRIRPDPPLSTPELVRWEELRWQIEELLAAPGYGQRPARKALRVPTDLKVHYSDPDHDALASAHEIAEGGLFLATDCPPPVGTPLHLKLTGDDGATIEVEGAVVWVRRAAGRGGPPGIGVEFAELDDEQREAVAYLVEEALAAL
jgi:uncharacterized protein (TIGR02266 family)